MSRQTYKGGFKPRNPEKYQGDMDKIKYRSSWELGAFNWCDKHPGIIKWSSEEVVVPYRCRTDGEMHRYFVDLYIKFSNLEEYLIEIKPSGQTIMPKSNGRRTKKFLMEVETFQKNTSKWEAASEYARRRGMTFEIWTEETLKSLGIKIL